MDRDTFDKITANPNRVRFIMTIEPNGTHHVGQYLNSEMVEAFGAKAVAEINAGNRAIFHARHAPNMIAIDMELAALAM